MGKTFEQIDERLRRFIEAQRIFFVATAPSGDEGHVNLSPKGLDSFRILDATSVAYLDFVGSGAETIAHLRQNGRIVIMMCAFEGPPNIVRLYGRGEVLEPADAGFQEMHRLFPQVPGTRAIILVKIERVSDSCGYGVPIYEYKRDRAQLVDWAERKGEKGLLNYQVEKNGESIDGIPALRWPRESE